MGNEASNFAWKAHEFIGQKRKYVDLEYGYHVNLVADTVRYNTNASQDVINAAYLHDILEDVFPKNSHYSYELLETRFGKTTADLVLELTNVYTKEKYPTLNRAQRKELELKRLKEISPEAQDIKVADIMDNIKDIVQFDPQFALTYLPEQEAKLKALTKANSGLLKICFEKLKIAKHQLSQWESNKEVFKKSLKSGYTPKII